MVISVRSRIGFKALFMSCWVGSLTLDNILFAYMVYVGIIHFKGESSVSHSSGAVRVALTSPFARTKLLPSHLGSNPQGASNFGVSPDTPSLM